MNISKEIIAIRELLKLTQEELANKLNVPYETINRWEAEKNDVETKNVEKVYEFAFSNGIFINAIYEQLMIEEYQNEKNKVLFHGCKTENIVLPIDLSHSKPSNDFGVGFYLGENFNQAATYIANSQNHYVYCFKLNLSNLNTYQFHVNKEWMIAVAYYRGWITQYKNHPFVQSIISNVNKQDILIAPIADNRMFDIISEFVRGEITDMQCEHALAATNLGLQYVLKTQKAIDQILLLNTSYVSNAEKKELVRARFDMNNLSQDKVKVARIEYRGKGQYIDELLK